MVAVGAVSAADNSDSTISDSPDDFKLNEDLDDGPNDDPDEGGDDSDSAKTLSLNTYYWIQ